MPPTFNPAAARTTLFAALRAAARRHGNGKIILEDPERQPLTYGRLVLASLALGDRLSRLAAPGEAVGILLPSMTATVATLLGLNAFGRVAGLLNFTAGTRRLASAVRTGPLPAVVTSRRFIETAGLQAAIEALAATEATPGRPTRIIYLEDIRREIGLAGKAKAFVRACLAGGPSPWRRQSPDAPAVILFTSGTEGEPKGVVLSNANLCANAAQILAHAAGFLTPEDVVMNPLPVFHSFGLTAATLMPLLNGMKVVLYPSPLHYKQIPKLIAATQATILFATDTFLQGYARSAETSDLASLRYVIAGAERVKETTRKLWAGTGATILEGYGATECSPVIACNVPGRVRDGSVGPLLPGIEARLEPVEGIASGGRLLVRGPNVMSGYLLPDLPGKIVPPAGGWHDTGDIVSLDDGFVTITGRARRFAKIGGEMVSLAAIETLASELWQQAAHVVVNIPDPRKGESLVLVTDQPDARRDALVDHAQRQGFPELWLPRSVVIVDAIPVLGSGKVDFPAVNELARRSRTSPEPNL